MSEEGRPQGAVMSGRPDSILRLGLGGSKNGAAPRFRQEQPLCGQTRRGEVDSLERCAVDKYIVVQYF